MRWQTLSILIIVIISLPIATSGIQFDLIDKSDKKLRFNEISEQKGLDDLESVYVTGVFINDFNADRWPDLLVIGSGRPILYRNTGGEFERAEVLPELSASIKGALFLDYNNDGWEDFLLLSSNSKSIFLENNNGEFSIRKVGLEKTMPGAVSAAAADYDEDGCLDVFVAQNGDWQSSLPARSNLATQNPDIEPRNIEVREGEDNGRPNYLFNGNCSSFKRVKNAGISGNRWSTATAFVDFTDDDHPDIYVANDFNYDILYINQGDGTFERHEISNTNRHEMSSEVGDFNNDGLMDLFATSISFNEMTQSQRAIPGIDNTGNNLLLSRGNGTFRSAEFDYGVADTDGWGWASVATDLDNDGDLDLVHTRQHYTVNRSTIRTPPRIWLRKDDQFVTKNASKLGFEVTNGLGMANFDYDRDGDQDLVVAGGELKLYENHLDNHNHWLQVTVESNVSRPIIGTQVIVSYDNQSQHSVIHSEADYRSQDARTLHFGFGEIDTVNMRVVWPDGTVHTFENVPVDTRIIINAKGQIHQIS